MYSVSPATLLYIHCHVTRAHVYVHAIPQSIPSHEDFLAPVILLPEPSQSLPALKQQLNGLPSAFRVLIFYSPRYLEYCVALHNYACHSTLPLLLGWSWMLEATVGET